jgi:hypothetical protein
MFRKFTRSALATHGGAKMLTGALLMAMMLLGAAAHAAAPRMCIPDALGIPGTSGAPDWFTPGQLTATNNPNKIAYQPSDPRWRGAMSLDYGSGSVSQVEYRAMYTGAQQSILLSWQVKSIMQFAVDNTALYAGFYAPVANKGALITVTLKATSTGTNLPEGTPTARSAAETQSNGTPFFAVSLTTGTGADAATWTAPVAQPAWLTSSLRVWINAQTNPYTWTVQLLVPVNTNIASGIDVQPASFRMWHYTQTQGLLSANTPPVIVPYTWPRPDPGQPVLTYASFQQGIQKVFPPATGWGEFALVANPDLDANCGGVYLANDHIGTRVTPFNSQIKLNADNTFFAEPENRTTTAINSNVLSATFRIANWGSQVGDDTAASWTAPSALTNVASGGVAASSLGNIEGHWNPSNSLGDVCPFIGQSGAGGVTGNGSCPNANPTRMLHQCILVKLQGPGLNFVRDSASRNMDFVKASRFEREAEISVVGLAALPAPKRDVFMYVERRNMPRYPLKEGEQPPTVPPVPDVVPNPNNVAVGRLPQRRDEDYAALMPTWIVHSYHDTGETIHLAGGDFKVVAPQTAFGYFVVHEGAFNGWADVIEGADRLREDLYKVAPPNDGAVRVKTVIQAVEGTEPVVGQDWPPSTTPTTPHKPWWLWFLIALLLLVVIVVLSRRKKV